MLQNGCPQTNGWHHGRFALGLSYLLKKRKDETLSSPLANALPPTVLQPLYLSYSPDPSPNSSWNNPCLKNKYTCLVTSNIHNFPELSLFLYHGSCTTFFLSEQWHLYSSSAHGKDFTICIIIKYSELYWEWLTSVIQCLHVLLCQKTHWPK